MPEILEYIGLRPADTEFYYAAAVCYQRLADPRRAIELGRIVRWRDPANVRNLMNLAEAYFQNTDPEQGRAILEEVLRLEPDNATARGMLKS